MSSDSKENSGAHDEPSPEAGLGTGKSGLGCVDDREYCRIMHPSKDRREKQPTLLRFAGFSQGFRRFCLRGCAGATISDELHAWPVTAGATSIERFAGLTTREMRVKIYLLLGRVRASCKQAQDLRHATATHFPDVGSCPHFNPCAIIPVVLRTGTAVVLYYY